jgi:hypothetical protein
MSPESLEHLTTSLSYDFNQESEYLIKTKPTSKNENGVIRNIVVILFLP